nr:PREDICTED: uncharacterized protein LOC102367407 isoform X2 [Latimeria chalumnae]|eukprot:XP_005998523.1 PREDICTED: uncharacterized protein LOC102367407 isoform X2 [Latimeria chalumnae]
MAGDRSSKPDCNNAVFSPYLLETKRGTGVPGQAEPPVWREGGGLLSPSFYEVIDGVLYRKKLEKGYIHYREVLEEEEKRRSVLASFHQRRTGKKLHNSLEETYRNVAENYWWEGMFFHVRDYIQGCKDCKERTENMHMPEENLIFREVKSHGADLLVQLNSQRQLGLFCDVALIVEGVTYTAHGSVLAAVSEYFHEMLTEVASTSAANITVDLTGFSRESFMPLLEFSYTSALSLKPDNFEETYALARHLRIWQVVDLCKELQKKKLQLNNTEKPGMKQEERDFFSFMDCSCSVSDTKYGLNYCDKKPNILPDARKNNKYPADLQVSSKGSKNNDVKCAQELSEFMEAKAVPNLPECSVSLYKEVLNSDPSGLSTSPNRCLRLLDFKSPSKSTEASPKSCPADTRKRSCSLEKKYFNEDTPTEYKHLQFSHPLELSLEWAQESTLKAKEISGLIKVPLKSPARQTTEEEEIQSPNTVEKYKLLSLLGLRRKTSLPVSEELTGWRQKKRLRKPKMKNYSELKETKRRKPVYSNGTQQRQKPAGKCVMEMVNEIKSTPLSPPLLGQRRSCDEKNKPDSSSPKKIEVVKDCASSTETKCRATFKRKGKGLIRKCTAEARKLQSASSKMETRYTLQQLRKNGEELTGSCNALRNAKITRSGNENRQLLFCSEIPKSRAEIAGKEQLLENSVSRKERRLGCRVAKRGHNLGPSLESGTLKITGDCKTLSVEDAFRDVGGKGKKRGRLLNVDKQKAALGGKGLKLGSVHQKRVIRGCKVGLWKRVRAKKTIEVENILLGKRKRKPTQKLLEAGFSFGLPTGFYLQDGMRGVEGYTTQEKGNTKKYTHRNVKSSEIGSASKNVHCSKTKGAKHSSTRISHELVKTKMTESKSIKTVLLYGKKLLNLSCKSSFVKKKEPGQSTTGLVGKQLAQLTTSETTRLLEIANTGYNVCAAKELPKKLRDVAKILKTAQPNALVSLRRNKRSNTKGPVQRNALISTSHTCSECKATFMDCDVLIMHKIRHVEGKLWPCPLCGKSFFRQKNVRIHLQSHEQKLYRCKMCIKE